MQVDSAVSKIITAIEKQPGGEFFLSELGTYQFVGLQFAIIDAIKKEPEVTDKPRLPQAVEALSEAPSVTAADTDFVIETILMGITRPIRNEFRRVLDPSRIKMAKAIIEAADADWKRGYKDAP